MPFAGQRSRQSAVRRKARAVVVMKALRQIIIATVLLSLVGCSVSVPAISSAKAYRYSGGSSIAEWNLTALQCEALNTWIVQNSEGWTPSPVSWAPGLIVYMTHSDSSQGSLNILKAQVVLVHEGDQFTRDFSADQITALRQLLEQHDGQPAAPP